MSICTQTIYFYCFDSLYLFMHMCFRFYEPKLLDAATKVKIRCIERDSLSVRYKTQIAMLINEKLRKDAPAQQEASLLSWLRTVAPVFPVNGSKVIYIYSCNQNWMKFVILTRILSTDYYNSQATNVLHHSIGEMQTSWKENYICLVIFGYRSFRNWIGWYK